MGAVSEEVQRLKKAAADWFHQAERDGLLAAIALRHKSMAHPRPHSTPNDALWGLAEMTASFCYGGITPNSGVEAVLGPNELDLGQELPVLMTATLLMHAVPYLWMDTISESIISMAMPEHTVSEAMVPHPIMWWDLERERLTADVWPEIGNTQSMLVAVQGGYLYHFLIGDGRFRDGRNPVLTVAALFRIPFGTHTSELDNTTRAFYMDVARMLSFISSPYIPKERRRLSRPDRRRLEREGVRSEILSREVEFVTLRRYQPSDTSRRDDDDDEDEPGRVSWKWRWVVSGHVRNQWFPSERVHRPMYIPPYVKGPADRPLKPTGYKVAR